MQSDNWHSFTGTIIDLSTKYLNKDFKQKDVSLLGSIIILHLSTWQSWAQLLNKQCNTLLLTYANFWYHNLLSFSGFIFMFFFQNFEVSFYLLTNKLKNQKDETKMSIFILPDISFNVTLKRFCRSFYKQSIFDPRPENCLKFSKKSPPKFV